MARKNITTKEETALRAHVFKASVTSILKGLGASKVELHGLDTIQAYTAAYVPLTPTQWQVKLVADWPDGTLQRRLSYNINLEYFDHMVNLSGLGGAKLYAISVAKEMLHERIQDVLSRATMVIPLAEL